MLKPKKIARKILPAGVVPLLEKTNRNNTRAIWQARYGYPAKGMRVIAVTGTNGKTTTASYINAMLRHNGFTTAVFTTAYLEIAGTSRPNLTHMTVSSQRNVQRFFKECKTAAAEWIILEVTSHALDQGRLDGVRVEGAVITNLTHEHLDYHKTMEAYAAAKSRLLSPVYGPKWCILNHDDAWFNYFKEKSSGEILSYGENSEADLRLTGYDLSSHGFSSTARYHDEHIAFTSGLIGKFNAYNALAAYGVGLQLDLDVPQISEGIAGLKGVPGRMEPVSASQPFNVIVDYAITQDALKHALTALREITEGKLMIVFGATGDRDKAKRGPMGETAGQLADKVFLTDDETYTEDPEAIRRQVYKGIKKARAEKKTKVVADRREAIKSAFQAAKAGDTVLLAGLGHQDYRNMGGRKEPWDERNIACDELKMLEKLQNS